MLSEENNDNVILKKLDLILQENREIKSKLDTFNKRFVGFERSVTVNSRHVQEVGTLVRRIQPYVEKAMGALHQAFKIVCNSLMSQREEISELTGSVLDDVHIV